MFPPRFLWLLTTNPDASPCGPAWHVAPPISKIYEHNNIFLH